MSNLNRLTMDRRSGDDRRRSYRLGYFINGGVERRSGNERRVSGERRRFSYDAHIPERRSGLDRTNSGVRPNIAEESYSEIPLALG